MPGHLLLGFIAVSMASVAIGVILGYCGAAIHHDHKKGHR